MKYKNLLLISLLTISIGKTNGIQAEHSWQTVDIEQFNSAENIYRLYLQMFQTVHHDPIINAIDKGDINFIKATKKDKNILNKDIGLLICQDNGQGYFRSFDYNTEKWQSNHDIISSNENCSSYTGIKFNYLIIAILKYALTETGTESKNQMLEMIKTLLENGASTKEEVGLIVGDTFNHDHFVVMRPLNEMLSKNAKLSASEFLEELSELRHLNSPKEITELMEVLISQEKN